jgi:hypothetical protein
MTKDKTRLNKSVSFPSGFGDGNVLPARAQQYFLSSSFGPGMIGINWPHSDCRTLFELHLKPRGNDATTCWPTLT